jgi:NAD(P)-dependent dehydrogenase (short-subunit alcohol dehydrogenase family)
MSKSTIIVTGAAGNLGTAVVERLLQDHEHLSLTVGPNADRDRIPPGNWSAETVDLMNEQAAAAYVERTGEQFDRIDAAVLLVGGYAPGGLAETDGAAIQKMYRLNFETAYFMVRPLLARFKAQGGGRFVFIGSRPALDPSGGKNLVAYTLSKGMVSHLAELINAEGKEDNIVASVIAPSTLDTPLNREAMPAADFDQWVPPARIADTIAFLLSPAGRMLREPVVKIYNRA